MKPPTGWEPPAPLTLLGRKGCHLCDQVRPLLAEAAAEHAVAWAEVDVDTDPALRAAFGEMVPVTILDGAVLDYWRLDQSRLRAALSAR